MTPMNRGNCGAAVVFYRCLAARLGVGTQLGMLVVLCVFWRANFLCELGAIAGHWSQTVPGLRSACAQFIKAACLEMGSGY